MLKDLPIVGGSYTDPTRAFDVQDCVNYIPEKTESDGARAPSILRGAPGFTNLHIFGTGPHRGGRDVEGKFYCVSGGSLYSWVNGVGTNLGAIAGTGRVCMAHNQITSGHELIIVNGTQGYIWNDVKKTLTKITDPDYPGSAVVDYLNSFFVQVRPDGTEWFTSDLARGARYLSTDTYESESDPDRIVCVIVDHGEVIVLGTNSTDIFWNAGAVDATFESKQIPIAQGCAGKYTPCRLDNSVFLLGNDGIFYRLNGYTFVRISTHCIEQAIANLNWSQAFSFVYTDRGHKIYYTTFPDGQTWGYDVATGLWHRRESFNLHRWRISTLTFSAGKWLAGDYENGNLYELDWEVFDEAGDPLIARRTTAYLSNHQNKLTMNRLELVMGTGGNPQGNLLDESGILITEEDVSLPIFTE
jgi:hypothetical protein